jgi:hypothetical protein
MLHLTALVLYLHICYGVHSDHLLSRESPRDLNFSFVMAIDGSSGPSAE